jgi:hypothetical protein
MNTNEHRDVRFPLPGLSYRQSRQLVAEAIEDWEAFDEAYEGWLRGRAEREAVEDSRSGNKFPRIAS